MSTQNLPMGVVTAARPPSIASRSFQPGLFHLIVAALLAWWVESKRPPDVPANLRADLGLPPADEMPGRWSRQIPMTGWRIDRD